MVVAGAGDTGDSGDSGPRLSRPGSGERRELTRHSGLVGGGSDTNNFGEEETSSGREMAPNRTSSTKWPKLSLRVRVNISLSEVQSRLKPKSFGPSF